MNSIKNRLIFTLLLVSLVPILIFSGSNLIRNSNDSKEKVQELLLSIAKNKQNILEKHLQDYKRFSLALANSKNFKQIANELTNNNFSNNSTYQEAFENLKHFQDTYWGPLHHIFVVDLKGQVVLSSAHGNSTYSHLGQNISDSSFFENAKKSVQITDFYGFKERDHYHQLLMQPIKNFSGQVGGVLIFELEIGYINQLLNKDFGLGKTGKIYLSTLEGLPVVREVDSRRDLIQSEGLIEAIRNENAIGEYQKNKNDWVVGVYLKSQKYPWVLVSEIDRKEAYQENTQIIKGSIGVVLLTIVFVFFLALKLADNIATPIVLLTQHVKKMSMRNFHVSLKVNSNDEIGDLARGFNAMAKQLREFYSGLEKKVDLRTAELEKNNQMMRRTKNVLLNMTKELKMEQAKIAEQKKTWKKLIWS